MAKSLVLFRIDKLNASKAGCKSADHIPRGTKESKTKPTFTKLLISKKKIAGNYLEAKIVHREGLAISGDWHDKPIREVVTVSTLPAYYNIARKVFIVEGPNSLASAAMRRLNKDCSSDLRLVRVKVDFNALLSSQDDIEVLGAWAMSPNNEIRTRAAFSDADLRKLADFSLMSGKGQQFSNLSLRMPFDEQNLRVNISRNCAAFFLEPVVTRRGLRFMEHLAGFRIGVQP